MKNIRNFISYKKGSIQFWLQTPTSLQKGLGFLETFFLNFREKYGFFRKIVK